MAVSGDRPEYLGPTLESWVAVRGLSDWQFIFAVEPGKHVDLCVELIERHFSDQAFSVLRNARRLGVSRNPHFVLNRGFDVAEFAVLAEEDATVSNDILEYFSWADLTFGKDSVGAVCASEHRNSPGVDPAAWFRDSHFGSMVWGTWRDRWVNSLRDTWDFDYTSSPVLAECGWDWNVDRVLRAAGMCCVFPEVSRSLHIGEYGEHFTPDLFLASQAQSFVSSPPANLWVES